MYDPHDHARELRIPVVRHPLTTCNGMWLPEQGIILLRLRMRRVLERNVLAHEIAHAVLGHTHQECGPLDGRQERQANRLAATWLVDPGEFAVASRAYDDPGRVCAELEVTPTILAAYLGTAVTDAA